MPAYLEQGLLKRNPFETIDRDGVGELVKIGAAAGSGGQAQAQARRVRRARRRPGVDRAVLRGRPRLRELLAVPGADRPPGRRPGRRRRRRQHHEVVRRRIRRYNWMDPGRPLAGPDPTEGTSAPTMTPCSPPSAVATSSTSPSTAGNGWSCWAHRRPAAGRPPRVPPRGPRDQHQGGGDRVGRLDLASASAFMFVVIWWFGGAAGRRVHLGLPHREEPQRRQRVRLGADHGVLRWCHGCTSTACCSGASSARS